MTVVLDGPSWVQLSVVDVRQRILRKSRRSLGIGSLTTRMVVQDGPSWERRSVACGCWWTLGENWTVGVRNVGTDPTTVRRGYEGPLAGSRSVTQ